MIFSLAIYSAPQTSQASYSAYQFALSLLAHGHQLYRVFFYQAGVYHASSLITPPQDELDLTKAWQLLAQAHNVDMVVCIASALRRGILGEDEASRYDKPNSNLTDGFTISGLGQLLEAAVHSDRVITFGS
jgi:tRNA 2-thiouridine synthesizing protein D